MFLNKLFTIILVSTIILQCFGQSVNVNKLKTKLSWKQLGYDFNGIKYTRNLNYQWDPDVIVFNEELPGNQSFFIQYNNIPIGLEIYKDKAFIAVPRRRPGIPSTLNYVSLTESPSPLLKPYPNVESVQDIVSVYRPRIDSCHRLWMVDTGLYEVPDDRRQIQPPAILIYDLKTNERILRYELENLIKNGISSAGLTSIVVDIKSSCEDAFAYINDLATYSLTVFSLKSNRSWNLKHSSFNIDPKAVGFTAAGQTITWRDGLFSIALSDPDPITGYRTAYYHSLVSHEEFSVSTSVLRENAPKKLEESVKVVGNKGPDSQSGTHGFHSGSRNLIYANVAKDAIICWNIDTKLTPENAPIVIRDNRKLAYISDLKVVQDDVWLLVNQIPRFVLSTLNPEETNFYIHKVDVRDMIKGTSCEPK